MVGSAVTVITYPATGDEYEWSGSTVSIVSPGEYEFAKSDIPDNITIHVNSNGVTLDGSHVTIKQINGNSELNLKNITIHIDDPDYSGAAINRCFDIVNSSISVKSNQEVSGIDGLYGNMDDTTIIIESRTSAVGVEYVFGSISGGKFTIIGEEDAVGVSHLYGNSEISDGKFTVTGDFASGVSNLHDHAKIIDGEFEINAGGVGVAVGYINGDGIVNGGKFTVNGMFAAFGVNQISDNGIVNNGKFEVNGGMLAASGVADIRGNGAVTGGEFTVTGDAITCGVADINDDGVVDGGKFIVNGGASAGILNISGNGAVSNGEFIVDGLIASGISEVRDYGVVDGGAFIVTGYADYVSGVRDLSDDGKVSKGKFTVKGDHTFGIFNVSGNSLVSGGEFWSVGTEQAYGIYEIYGTRPVDDVVTDGTINAWGPTEETTVAIGSPKLPDGTYIPGYRFTSPIDGKQYTKAATVYTINDATLREMYDPRPITDFTWRPVRVLAHEPTTFTDLSTGNPDNWHWDFGDGATSTKQNPEHVYENAGTYLVNLTVNNGEIMATKEIEISPISLWFRDIASSGLTVTFQVWDEYDGYDGYYWYFSDGKLPEHWPGNETMTHTHTFPEFATYTVELTGMNSTTEKRDSVVRSIVVG